MSAVVGKDSKHPVFCKGYVYLQRVEHEHVVFAPHPVHYEPFDVEAEKFAHGR